jgi:hypothetical protein
VQVCEFFVGHGRVGHNAGIYRNLLIPCQLSAAKMPPGIAGPAASGGQSGCRAGRYQRFVTSSGPQPGSLGRHKVRHGWLR